MRNPGGYAAIFGDGPQVFRLDYAHAPLQRARGLVEMDTFCCGHCGRQVHVPAKAALDDLGSMCRACMKMICPACVNRNACVPLEAQLERAEARERALRSYGM